MILWEPHDTPSCVKITRFLLLCKNKCSFSIVFIVNASPPGYVFLTFIRKKSGNSLITLRINLNYPHFHFVCDLHFSHSCLAAEYMLGFSGFSSLFLYFYEIYVKVDLFSDSAL